MSKIFPAPVKYLFTVYIAGIAFFTIFRLLLIYNNFQQIPQTADGQSVMLQAMFMGFRFDTVISLYIIALPFLILTVLHSGFRITKPVLKTIHVFLCVLYIACFLGCAADIPYFHTYNERLNITILNWIDSPMFMIKMVAEEWSYFSYFLLFIAMSVVFCFILARIYKRHLPALINGGSRNQFSAKQTFIYVLYIGLVFIGIRGRIEEKSPIVVGTAYFSKYNFPNKIGLNPMFSFLNSWFDTFKEENKHLHLMPDKEAMQLAGGYLGATGQSRQSPIARTINYDIPEEKHNVVLVIMESMSADFLTRFGNTKNLTPNLDSLAARGYSFDHFYSAGIHTYNGIFSSLYSFPALMARHTMTDAVIPHYTGLPYLMKQKGYNTIFFMTHDEQFDNEGGFVMANNMDNVIGLEDYPASAKLSTLGVPDHFMFSFSMSVLNKYYKSGKPFFSTFVTTSNHGPFIVPDGIPFKPKHPEVREGVVEYADWAIGNFMDSAKKQPWYANTVFVFVADHGTYEGHYIGDMGYSLNHIPCIIYSPLLKDAPRVINNVGGQIDIYPTIAGLLHLDHMNNTMGIDLLNDKRPWAYFSADDKIAVADTNNIYIWYKDKAAELYSLHDAADNLLPYYAEKADSMKRYGFSMLQTTQWMLLNGKTGAVN